MYAQIQMKTIDMVCYKSVTHPLCMDKAGMLNIDLHFTDY